MLTTNEIILQDMQNENNRSIDIENFRNRKWFSVNNVLKILENYAKDAEKSDVRKLFGLPEGEGIKTTEEIVDWWGEGDNDDKHKDKVKWYSEKEVKEMLLDSFKMSEKNAEDCLKLRAENAELSTFLKEERNSERFFELERENARLRKENSELMHQQRKICDENKECTEKYWRSEAQ